MVSVDAHLITGDVFLWERSELNTFATVKLQILCTVFIFFPFLK